MRILFLSTWFPHPPDNGSKLRAHYLIRSLAHTHQVTAIAFQPEHAHRETMTSTAGIADTVVWGVADDPFRYVDLPQLARYLSPIPLVAWPSRKMQHAVRSVACKTNWDAVVAFQTPAARYALMPQSTALVLDIDSSLSFISSKRLAAQQRVPLARLKALISFRKTMQYESRLARHFDICTVVSPLEIDFIRRMVRGTSCRVEVSGNGVDCVHNRPGLAQQQTSRLIYNGSLTYSANYDAMRYFLAEIYPHIKAQVPGVSLSITGSTKGVDVTGLALDDTVHLTGFVEDVRLPVAEATVCVAPIRQGHGTRLKILEAMALGTPVVATSKGAEGLQVADGEHLLLADNPELFALRTVELLGNVTLRARVAGNARRLVEEKHDWQQIGSQFVALVEQAAAAKQQGGRER